MVKWKTAVYLRLSVDDGQKAESNSISNQKEIINNYAKNEKDIKIVDYYIDDGYTGTDFERPGFQRLLLDIKKGKINTIIVKDLSRLGRNYIEVGNYLEQIFPFYNIRFISINDNIDSFKDPKSSDNIIVPVKNLMNDEYARDISNKVRSVLNTKKINGQFVGVSAPYGYLKNPDDKHKFIIDKKASKIVKKIFKMILDGKSKKEIVSDLNQCGFLPPSLYKTKESIVSESTNFVEVWNTRMIDRILQNQSYTGDLIQGKRKRISHKVHKLIHVDSKDWIVVENQHESLISREDFEQVQNIVYNREIRVNKNNKYDIFSGHLKCADCGNNLTIRRSKGYEYYYCSSYLKQKKCTKHVIEKKKLEKQLLDIINSQINLLIDIDCVVNEIVQEKNINYDIEVLSGRKREINDKAIKYETLLISIDNDFKKSYLSKDEYMEYSEEYNSIIKNLNNERIQIEKEMNKLCLNVTKNIEWIKEFQKNKNLKLLNKKVIVELINYVYIYDNGNIKVSFNYQNEYIEALDFINSHKYDIISKEFIYG